MKSINKSVIDIIKEAIKLEIEGRKFFEYAEKLTHNKLGKKMFQKLAKEEVGHLDSFGKLFTSIIGSEDWEKFVNKEESKSKSSIIEELTSRLEKGERASELEAISIGMDLEKKSIAFFEKSANEVSDPIVREIISKICDEERFHYDLLQAEYDSLTNSGFWLDVAEFRMDAKY